MTLSEFLNIPPERSRKISEHVKTMFDVKDTPTEIEDDYQELMSTYSGNELLYAVTVHAAMNCKNSLRIIYGNGGGGYIGRAR